MYTPIVDGVRYGAFPYADLALEWAEKNSRPGSVIRIEPIR